MARKNASVVAMGAAKDAKVLYRQSVEAWLKAAALMATAKAACAHGEWLTVVKASGIPGRTVQRMLRLDAAGVKSATVADLGGIRAVDELLAEYPGRTIQEAVLARLVDDARRAWRAFLDRDELRAEHLAIRAAYPASPFSIGVWTAWNADLDEALTRPDAERSEAVAAAWKLRPWMREWVALPEWRA